jgi:PAS domain S-box-containing protein
MIAEEHLRELNVSLQSEVEERRALEEQAREQANLFALFVAHTPAAVAMFDTQMRYLQASEQWLRDYHLDGQSLIGRSHYEVFPDIPETWKAKHQTVLQGAVYRVDEEAFPRADGTVEWLQYELRPWNKSGGEIGGLIMFTQVITARKRAEDARRSEQDFLQSLLDNLNTGVISCDATGAITHFNNMAVEFHGAPDEVPLDEVSSHYGLFHLDGTPMVPEEVPMARALKGERIENFEFVVRRPNRADRVLATSVQPIEDVSGAIGGAVAIAYDITQRRQVEDALRLAEQRLSTVLANLPIIVFTVDLQGIFTLSEGRGLSVLGLEPGAVVGQSAFEIYRDNTEIVDSIRRTLGGEITSWTTKVGDIVFDSQGVPLKDEQGRIVGALGVAIDVSQRTKAEASVFEQQRFLRQVIDTIPGFVCVKDWNSRYLLANRELAEAFGTTVDDLEGKTDYDFVLDFAEIEGFLRDDREVMSSGKPKFIPEEAITPKGWNEERWLQTIKVPLQSSSSAEPQVLCVATDISQRKKAEAELRQSEERFRSVVSFMQDGLTLQDAQGVIEYCNDSAGRILGLSTEQLHGLGSIDPRWKAIHEDGTPFPGETHPAMVALRKGETQRNIVQGVHKPDGSLTWISVNSVPLFHSGESRPYGVVTTFTDITEHRRAEASRIQLASEQALRFQAEENERRYLTLAEAMPQIIWTARPDGGLDYYNHRWFDYTGMTLEETQGWGWQPVLHPDDVDNCINRWTESVQSGGDYEVEYRFKRASDNTYRWHLGRALALRDEEGRIVKWFGTCTDIDDQKRAQDVLQQAQHQLEQQVEERTQALAHSNRSLQNEVVERRRIEKKLLVYNEQLERSNRELQDFAYVASHDLQEPLRKIQAFGGRLQTKFGDILPEEGSDYIDRMTNAASRMQTLISDLLSFSRVTTNAKPFVPVDLQQIALEVSGDLEVLLENSGGRLEIGELPTIEADALQMRQLMQNLIGNALKFRRPDTPPIVRVKAEWRDSVSSDGEDVEQSSSRIPKEGRPTLCRLTIEDNGIGFDERYLDRIFVPFQRLHGRETYEGTGIGLAICRKIVERHGGSITARSRPGEGTCFIVSLPLLHAAQNGIDNAKSFDTDNTLITT